MKNLLSTPLFTISTTQTTVGSLLVVCGIVMLTLLIGNLACSAIQRYAERLHPDDHVDGASTRIYGISAKLIVWFIGFELSLHLLGINLSSMLAASGFLAIVGGLAMKDFAENFLSGIILKTENTLCPGDLIVIDGKRLIVQSIGLRTVNLTTGTGEEVMMPNSMVAHSAVKNLTRDNRQSLIAVNIGVSYDADLKVARKTLEDMASGVTWRATDTAATVSLAEFEDSRVLFRVAVWIDNANDTLRRQSDLREAVWWALKDANVEIGHRQEIEFE